MARQPVTDKPHSLPDATPTVEQYRRDHERRSRPEYAAYRMALINRILAEGLTPLQVARDLEANADRFYEITLEEVRLLRYHDQRWGGIPAEGRS